MYIVGFGCHNPMKPKVNISCRVLTPYCSLVVSAVYVVPSMYDHFVHIYIALNVAAHHCYSVRPQQSMCDRRSVDGDCINNELFVCGKLHSLPVQKQTESRVRKRNRSLFPESKRFNLTHYIKCHQP